MEILPLLFMQAAVLNWNTCTIKCKTHPQRSWRWKSCNCCSCRQQCWNGKHVPPNAKHTQIEAKDGNPVLVIHELSEYQTYNDAWSSRRINVNWQWVYKPQQIACNLTDVVSMHGGVHKLMEAKICKGIPNYHLVHFLFSTSAPQTKTLLFLCRPVC
jgi:hypothetical protein